MLTHSLTRPASLSLRYGQLTRTYEVVLKLHPLPAIKQAFAIDRDVLSSGITALCGTLKKRLGVQLRKIGLETTSLGVAALGVTAEDSDGDKYETFVSGGDDDDASGALGAPATATVTISMRASFPRMLMVGMVEAAAADTVVRSVAGIANAHVVECKVNGQTRPAVQTEGSALDSLWRLSEPALALSQLTSNDVYRMLNTYGVEAARACIVQEIVAVFGAYGISVDPHHTSLVADYMTQGGAYAALNRLSMGGAASPYLQMSYETCGVFLKDAALAGGSDATVSPSASIVMGQPMRHGTGAMDVIYSREAAFPRK